MSRLGENAMDVIYERCAGLDVHKKTVVACRIVPAEEGLWQAETRTFQTMTVDLLALADWLRAAAVTHVAMESTGVYWKPLFNILESDFEILLVNAKHIKQVPGRKTDVKDANGSASAAPWPTQGSFIPGANGAAIWCGIAPTIRQRNGKSIGCRNWKMQYQIGFGGGDVMGFHPVR
jgi:hypothetical protein